MNNEPSAILKTVPDGPGDPGRAIPRYRQYLRTIACAFPLCCYVFDATHLSGRSGNSHFLIAHPQSAQPGDSDLAVLTEVEIDRVRPYGRVGQRSLARSCIGPER